MIRISIAEAGKPPRLLTFSKSQITVGRDATHDLCLTGKGVSGTHCRLYRHGDAVVIEDLGSTNGTYVNRARISAPTPISSSDEVVLAIYRVQVLSDADSGVKLRPQAPGEAGGAVVVGTRAHAGPTAAHPGVTAALGGPQTAGPQSVDISQSMPSSGPSSLGISQSLPPAEDPSASPDQRQPKTRVKSPADIEWEREWEQIDRLATAWFKNGRPRKGLLRGQQLAHARRWLARGRGKYPQPKSAHREFIDTAARRRSLRLFGVMSAVTVVLAAGTVGGVYAYRKMQGDDPIEATGDTDGTIAGANPDAGGGEGPMPEVDDTDAVALANLAAGKVETNPELAALLAAEASFHLSVADQKNPAHPVHEALRRAMARIGAQTLRGHDGPLSAVAVSADGGRVATATTRRGEPVRLWDVTAPGLTNPPLLTNHDGRVTHMATTDDGHWLITADDDGLIMRWDLTASDPPGSGVRMDGHTTAVEAMHLAGTWLVTGDAGGRIRLWNVAAKIPTQVDLPGHVGAVMGVAVTPDGTRAASVSDDGTGRIWTLAGGTPKRRVATMTRPEEMGVGPLLSVAISPDGKWVLTGASDGIAWLWEAGSNLPGRRAPPPLMGKHSDAITHVGFSNDGAVAYTASNDDSVVLWDMTRENPNDKVLPWKGHTGDIVAVDVTGPGPEGDPTAGVAYLLSASSDGTARRWNLDGRDGAIEVEVLTGHNGSVVDLDASKDGRWVVTGGEDKTARVVPVWRDGLPDSRRVPGLGAARVGFGHTAPVRVVALNGGGNRLVTGSDDGTARVWDLVPPGRLRVLGVLGGHPGKVRAVAVTGAGDYAATGSEGGDLRLWALGKADPGANHLALKGHTKDVRGLLFTKKHLISYSTDGTARLWEMKADPQEGVIVLPHGDEVVAGAVSGDGRWLLTATGTEIKALLWDLTADNPAAGNVPLTGGHKDALTTVALGPKGRWAATGSRDYRVNLYDLQTIKKDRPDRTKLRGHDAEIAALAFSPNGRKLASGDGQGVVIAWDLTSKHPDESYETLEGPTSGVYELSWTADGKWLVAGSGDKGIYLWRMDGDDVGAPIVLEGHEGVVAGVAVSRDGSFVASGGYDGTARVWPLSASAIVPLVCARVGRWLTEAEWADSVGGQYVDRCG